jgi:hypothetical protein
MIVVIVWIVWIVLIVLIVEIVEIVWIVKLIELIVHPRLGSWEAGKPGGLEAGIERSAHSS